MYVHIEDAAILNPNGPFPLPPTLIIPWHIV
jgi:hypothetical protein